MSPLPQPERPIKRDIGMRGKTPSQWIALPARCSIVPMWDEMVCTPLLS